MDNAWSITSTIIAIGLFGWDVWQLSASRKNNEIQFKEKQLHKSQVKIWQHFANGINHNLMTISEGIRLEKLKDVSSQEFGEIIKGIQANANALYISLNEERLFSDDEIKQRQLDSEKAMQNIFSNISYSKSFSTKNVNS